MDFVPSKLNSLPDTEARRSYVPLADAFTDVLFILDDDGEGNAVSPIVSKVYLITVEGVKAKYEVPDEEGPGVVQEDVPP